MNYSTIFLIFTLLSIVEITNARIYYVDVPRNYNNYPEVYYTTNKNGEQASRDLDMTFAAGDPIEYSDTNNIIHPSRKDYIPPVLPVVDIIRGNDRPSYLYKWPAEVPTSRRIIYGGDSSFFDEGKKDRNLVKFNNGHRGEVVLELRVIANNDGL